MVLFRVAGLRRQALVVPGFQRAPGNTRSQRLNLVITLANVVSFIAARLSLVYDRQILTYKQAAGQSDLTFIIILLILWV